MRVLDLEREKARARAPETEATRERERELREAERALEREGERVGERVGERMDERARERVRERVGECVGEWVGDFESEGEGLRFEVGECLLTERRRDRDRVRDWEEDRDDDLAILTVAPFFTLLLKVMLLAMGRRAQVEVDTSWSLYISRAKVFSLEPNASSML